jgi:hypothetical protein
MKHFVRASAARAMRMPIDFAYAAGLTLFALCGTKFTK